LPAPSQFVLHVVETMRRFGPVQAKPMFGGWGLYHDGVFFALIAEEALYLKADDESRPHFEARGLQPFVYRMKDGDTITMTYFQAPEDALESPDAMAEWARRGYAAALRAQAARKKTAGRAKPRGGGGP
jgi:DNA transformation protein